MKRLHYCCVWIVVSCLYAVPAGAVLTSHNNSSFVEIISNPNPKFESKPAYPQYASVQFLQSDTKLTFASDDIGVKAKCASLGYMVPVSQCTGALKPSYLCNSDLNEAGAEQYTTNCCNSNLYTVTNPDACTDNATALPEGCYWGGAKKYRCACDRSRYPYSELAGEGCGTNGDFNVNNMCRAANASGEKISYYASCCPTSYEECDNNKHLVGKGNSCRIASGGTIVNKYEYCECSSSYDTICADAMLIDSSDTCTDSHGKFTRDNNCESGCSQTRETNIDSYLYSYVWHCLYKKDGATVKPTEGDLCAGYDRNMSSQSSTYYDECTAQGYVKTEADCYVSDLIMRCPNDSSKVWCLDGKYCTGFPVGEDACNDGARMKLCGSREQGVRCAYNDDRCNKCWEDGVYKPGCVNYDSSTKGDSEVCCKRGYRMADGICVKNVCDRTKFPYEQNPGSDQGQLEFCYAGDEDASLGYKTYFGYASCYSDATTGGMWKRADDNPRKCVCMRKDDDNSGRTWLPFGTDRYFDTNVDTSNNYTKIGFYKGLYGVTTSCTDAESSYFGYVSCFIGRTLGTTDATKGMCLSATETNRYLTMGDGDIVSLLNHIITDAGEPEVNISLSSLADDSQCISMYQHCRAPTGEVLGDASACALVVSGCNKGNEEACNTCYHKSNLTMVGGKYKAHNKFLLRMYFHSNTSLNLKFEKCPSGYTMSSGGGVCTRTCSINNLQDCALSFIVTEDGTDSSKKLGIVYYKDASKIVLLAPESVKTFNWQDAMTYAAAYYPGSADGDKTYENHALLGKGKWHLRQSEPEPAPASFVYLTLVYQMKGLSFGVGWYSTASGDQAYYRDYWSAAYLDKKTNQHSAPVMLQLNI